jgi:hypothetical protein
VNVEQGLRIDPQQGQMDLWRELQSILAEWRAAERRMAETPPGSAEHARAAVEVAQLRERYQRAYAVEHPTERGQG